MKERGGGCREENRLVTKLQYKQCMEPILPTKRPVSKSPGRKKGLAATKGPSMKDPGYRIKIQNIRQEYLYSKSFKYFIFSLPDLSRLDLWQPRLFRAHVL